MDEDSYMESDVDSGLDGGLPPPSTKTNHNDLVPRAGQSTDIRRASSPDLPCDLLGRPTSDKQVGCISSAETKMK